MQAPSAVRDRGKDGFQVSSNYHPDCMSAQASSALRKEEAAEAGRELRALLRLLTNLTQRDLLDFGSTPDGPRVDVAQVSTRSSGCSSDSDVSLRRVSTRACAAYPLCLGSTMV